MHWNIFGNIFSNQNAANVIALNWGGTEWCIKNKGIPAVRSTRREVHSVIAPIVDAPRFSLIHGCAIARCNRVDLSHVVIF
ncbi:hypothetical protein R6G99_09020, partial [Actinotignum timonense]|nr:hypothetical protein [Actinotignum timonense]